MTPEPKKNFKEEFMAEIIKQGFPVIAIFDFEDQGATIYAKSAEEVLLDDYGQEFREEKSKEPYSLKDLTEEGLFKLHNEGVRPGEKYWDESIQGAEENLGLNEEEE